MAEVGELQCIPLYSPLPPDLMHKFSEFAPLMMKHGKHGRKCFVATNIAETSLTIKGVVYVVDPGFSVQKVNSGILFSCCISSSLSENV